MPPIYGSRSGAMAYLHARLSCCFLGARLGAGGRSKRKCIAGSTIYWSKRLRNTTTPAFRLWARITRGARRELLKHLLQFSSIRHIVLSMTSMAR
jgi:hypothetical protein